MVVAVLEALPKQAAEQQGRRHHRNCTLTCANASGTRGFLDAYGFIIDDGIAKPLTAIRLRWWQWKRT
jgi:hypothetical protein